MIDQPIPGAVTPSRAPGSYIEHHLFEFVVGLEVQMAVRLQYPFSVMCMQPDVHPHDVDPPFLKHIVEAAVWQLRSTDVITTFSASSVGLLLIDAEPPALPVVYGRLRGELGAYPLIVQGRERRITWSAGGASYPRTAATASDLLRQAMDFMAQASREGGNHLRVAP